MDYEDIPLDENGSPLLSPIKYSFFDIAKQLEDMYITYRGRFVMMTLDGGVFVPRYKDLKSGKIKDQKITNKIVCGHLNGHYAICVYAGSASSKFICFDVDDGNPQTVRTIIDILSRENDDDGAGHKLSMQEKAIFIEADALQIEMGNVVSKATPSGSVIYDVAKSTQHKDRYSSLGMAVRYISELEDARKKKLNQRKENACIGIVIKM